MSTPEPEPESTAKKVLGTIALIPLFILGLLAYVLPGLLGLAVVAGVCYWVMTWLASLNHT